MAKYGKKLNFFLRNTENPNFILFGDIIKCANDLAKRVKNTLFNMLQNQVVLNLTRYIDKSCILFFKNKF